MLKIGRRKAVLVTLAAAALTVAGGGVAVAQPTAQAPVAEVAQAPDRQPGSSGQPAPTGRSAQLDRVARTSVRTLAYGSGTVSFAVVNANGTLARPLAAGVSVYKFPTGTYGPASTRSRSRTTLDEGVRRHDRQLRSRFRSAGGEIGVAPRTLPLVNSVFVQTRNSAEPWGPAVPPGRRELTRTVSTAPAPSVGRRRRASSTGSGELNPRAGWGPSGRAGRLIRRLSGPPREASTVTDISDTMASLPSPRRSRRDRRRAGPDLLEVKRVIVGQDRLVERLLNALVATALPPGGVPGVGRTSPRTPWPPSSAHLQPDPVHPTSCRRTRRHPDLRASTESFDVEPGRSWRTWCSPTRSTGPGEGAVRPAGGDGRAAGHHRRAELAGAPAVLVLATQNPIGVRGGLSLPRPSATGSS